MEVEVEEEEEPGEEEEKDQCAKDRPRQSGHGGEAAGRDPGVLPPAGPRYLEVTFRQAVRHGAPQRSCVRQGEEQRFRGCRTSRAAGD